MLIVKDDDGTIVDGFFKPFIVIGIFGGKIDEFDEFKLVKVILF